eukprot:COSAG02_NODE_1647_length_11517_cov_2.751533_12_plen_375_part_00
MYDALQLQLCGEKGTAASPVRPAANTGWQPHSTNRIPQRGGFVVYANAERGSDDAAGTIAAPLRTIEAAVSAVRKHRSLSQLYSATAAPSSGTNATIVLRAGTYYVDQPITLSAADSWLTITSFEHERVEVSGGVPLGDLEWKLQRDGAAAAGGTAGAPVWTMHNNTNNVFGEVRPGRDGKDGCVYIATTESVASCEQALAASPKRPKGGWKSFTWQPLTAGQFAGQCYGLTTDHWAPHHQLGFVSGRHSAVPPPPPKLPIAVTKVPPSVRGQITGLRVNGSRAIRARFPNIRSTESQPYAAAGPLTGYVTAKTEWKPPHPASPPTDIVVTQLDFPSVEWVRPHHRLSCPNVLQLTKCLVRCGLLPMVAANECQ